MEYKLKDLCRIKHGYAFKGKDILKIPTKYILVTPGNFAIGGGFKGDKCKYFNERGEFPKEYILKANDLIVTMTDLSVNSDTLGYGALVPENKKIYLHNQRIGLVYDIKGNIILKEYLYWFMRTYEYQKAVVASQSGTAIHHTSPERILEIVVDIPNIKEQQKIVNILFSIEKKIELNNQINDNLYNISKNIFRNFYNNNTGKWQACKIKDIGLYISDYVANGSFKSLAENVKIYDDKNYALFIRNTDLKVNFTQGRKYVDEHSYNFLNKSKLYGRELIISNVGDVGSIFLCPSFDIPMTLGNNVIMVDSKDTEVNYNYYLYYFFLSVEGQYLIDGITGGSAQPKFNKTDFRNSQIELPSKEEIMNFNNKVIPMYNIIEKNIKENETLEQIRDTLLPKLMNGEIDLHKIEI